MVPSDYSIGDLARHTGIKVATIRYYETVGLMPPPPRTEGNQRRYGKGALDRLNFIAHARAFGFSMEAVRHLLTIAAHPEQPCEDIDALVAERLVEVEMKISGLTRLRDELSDLLHTHDGGVVRECRIIEALSDHSACPPGHKHHGLTAELATVGK
ncbi:MerR family transcriptional regulator [Pelagibacterium luteolum]|uniref:DNA-binding transcriptional regulator, MerR family n=1 Tax=Pelagibacterium luteolum TaxID=440168 RepID=A0A1G7VJS5_9HYPH|nr:helix-turn-helix domain-containing protein [Pelagibacterium luteolum]SDG59937.1 DNA-binding transcriptional regulator, MerR family [Pelagibacterium luteolum]